MSKEKIIESLNVFKERLTSEVLLAYQQRGHSFGKERFQRWQKVFAKFLYENLNGEEKVLEEKLHHYVYMSAAGESDANEFWRTDGENMVSYIDSLIIDINNDEYNTDTYKVDKSNIENLSNRINKNEIFIVHGHDNSAKEEVARFVEKIGLKAIILHEQANKGTTIIEKIEKYTNVGFAIVLYTPCDEGKAKADKNLQNRARQNVVFEHGFLIGKIGRPNVCALVKDNVEKPNDISGVVYIDMDSKGAWKTDLVKELKECGYNIDANTLF